jgi:hypothetical protein
MGGGHLLNNIYYEQIEIWNRIDDETLKCYQMFKRLSDGLYAVQSKDTYRKNDLKKLMAMHDVQKYEVFLESDLSEKGIFCNSIEQAIEEFELSFA